MQGSGFVGGFRIFGSLAHPPYPEYTCMTPVKPSKILRECSSRVWRRRRRATCGGVKGLGLRVDVKEGRLGRMFIF